MTVSAMLADAILNNFIILVTYDDEVDYEGQNLVEALEAIEACDEIEIQLIEGETVIGWAFIVNDLDEDEQIADCSGWVTWWTDNNE